jgi:hypothetical protein
MVSGLRGLQPRPGLNNPSNAPPIEFRNSGFFHSTSNVNLIIDDQQTGSYKRRMMRWRTPHLGWIKMFLNPQNLTITEGKDIESTRTKAGFILQYAGEKLTQITMRGTTGSGGVEAINILRTLYRSEQIAFDQIALELERVAPVSEALQLASGLLDSELNAPPAQQLANAVDIALNIFQQPFPTLASLAANVELYFQGVLYRGYFTEFTVEENGEQAGLFDYTLNYTAHSRQGIRRNFMPWHRQPFSPIGAAGSDPNPLSFVGSRATSGSASVFRASETFTDQIASTILDTVRNRSTSSGSGASGESLTGEDLEDLV